MTGAEVDIEAAQIKRLNATLRLEQAKYQDDSYFQMIGRAEEFVCGEIYEIPGRRGTWEVVGSGSGPSPSVRKFAFSQVAWWGLN